MVAQIIDGKKISAEIKQEVAEEVKNLKKSGIQPGLATILVGDDPASHIYVKNKVKDCNEVGIYSEKIVLPKETTEGELISIIEELNVRNDIDGILVQLPLPSHIDEFEVIRAINPEKDVDGFHPINQGLMLIGKEALYPCTPAGIIEMLKRYNIEISGKNAVVIGRSNIVGKPAAVLLLKENATVTICHSRTKDLSEFTKNADILVVAVGRPKMITGDIIKEGAVVIDVGINRVDDKIVGDVDFDSASEVASYITPVPGGVGLVTRAMLLKNTLIAAKRRA
ncbi:MAG: bifunctional methylenetetrahydrofolate dehydrogenase/methenyltetrahydrofolate cyclohydrolase FolD, partial [Actinobacteria bacterium]|nr:bifunctional methylenetetrahydrofolate dehydrogenase/methenyltetrahydrofolate cyclohydrolase FolD [Actinomycetota bacterium]